MLATLTKITSNKVKLEWSKIKKDPFDEIKRVVARGVLLYYPDFNNKFKFHTDASDF